MPRYKLTLEYDGGPFRGWQRQSDGDSVQQALEDAVRGFCGEDVQVVAAGRTDAGVHASGQVAHLDLSRPVTPETLRNALNHHLRPRPVDVLAARCGPPTTSTPGSRPRRATTSIASSTGGRRSPSRRGRAWQVPAPLDAEIMHEAAQRLVGRHDFTSFRSALCQAKSPVKTLDRLTVRRLGDRIEIAALARSFLHHQVRNMVGTLKLVGEGRLPVEHVEAVLAARDRAAAGPTAPACGLYLMRVDY